MMGPSPIGHSNLRAFRKRFAAHFAERELSHRRQIVMDWYQSNYTVEQIATGTGYSLEFVHDVKRRFPKRCVVRFIKGHPVLVRHKAEWLRREKRAKQSGARALKSKAGVGKLPECR
jgi:hypothetical protein